MALLGSVDIPFTKSTKIAVDATDTAGQAQATAQTASQTATQAAATAADAAQAAQTAITTANGKNKAYYGATTPANPQPGDIWFVEDGSNNVTAIKHYDGTQWVTDVDNTALAQQISAAQAAADNAVTVGQTAQQVAQQAAQVGDSAAKAAEAAQQAANTAQTDAADAVTQANNAVDTANTAKQVASDAATQSSNAWTKAQDAMAEAQKKADATSVYTKTDIDNALKGYATTTTVNTLTGRVDSAETAIQQNTNAIQLKADKSTVDTLTGRVSTAEATLTAQADQIAARITKTDADAKYATQTALTATANSLTSSITAVQTNLDNLQVGGRNLIKDSNNFTNLGRNAGAQYTYKTSVSVPEWGAADATEIHVTGGTGTVKLYKSIVAPSVKDCDYTLSVWCKNIGNYPIVITANAFGTVILANGESKRVVISGKGNGINNFQLNIGTTADNINNPIDFVIWRAKGENGNKATDWSPAPEDMATQSQITQLANDINLRVKQNDVINQINISTEGILIDGKKVHITGQTTIDNAVIKDAMIQSMTANKLTAGTIDANVITVKNINASNIVTGTLDASKATVANIDASKITTGTLSAARIAAGSIDASKLNVSSLSALSANLGSVTAGNISGVNINIGNGNFSVDTSGNLVAKNANITGTINATAGNFSGTLQGATGTFTGTVEGATIKSSDRPSFSDPNFTNRAMLSNGTLSIESRNDDVGAYGQVKIDGGRLQALGVPGIFTMPDPYKPPKDNFTNYGSGYIYSANNLFINARKVAFGSANESNLNIDAWDGKINLKGGSIYAGFYDDLVIKAGSSRICFGDDRILSNTPLSILAWSDHGRIEGITGISMNTLDSGKFSNFYAGVWGEFRVTDASDTDKYKPVRASSFPTGSLAEFKTEITKWEASALDIINSADIYQYRLKDDVKNGKDKVRHGLVIGEGYHTPAEIIDGDGVEQYEMNSLSWKAIQELSASDSSNKERLSIVEEQNNNLLLKVAGLELELANIKRKLGDA